MKTPLEQLEDLTAVQTSAGNWNFNPYMHGMANGMIFALACMKGEEPKYLEAPPEWLADKKIEGEPVSGATDLVTEMSAALKGVVRVADRKTVEFDAARAAIAKADGRR